MTDRPTDPLAYAQWDGIRTVVELALLSAAETGDPLRPEQVADALTPYLWPAGLPFATQLPDVGRVLAGGMQDMTLTPTPRGTVEFAADSGIIHAPYPQVEAPMVRVPIDSDDPDLADDL